MPSNYFGGAPNAWQGGVEFSAAQHARRQKENALNALIGRFGPEAADPAALAALQGVQQSAELHPYALSGAQRADAAGQAVVDRHGAVAGSPAAVQTDQTMTAQQDAQRQRAAVNAANYLHAAIGRGADPGEAWDRVAPMLPNLGFPAEQLPAARETFLADPQSAIAMLRAADGEASGRVMGQGQPFYDSDGNLVWATINPDGTPNVIEGLTPALAAHSEGRLGQAAVRLGQGWRRLDQEAARMRGFDAPTGFEIWEDQATGQIHTAPIRGSAQELQQEQLFGELEAADRNAYRVAQGLLAAANTVTRDGNDALEKFEALGPIMGGSGTLSSILRRASSNVWGTQARRLERSIQSVLDNIGIDKLLEIKATGAGLGHVPHAQMVQLQSVLGRLGDLDRDPKDLMRDMRDALTRYDEILGFARQEMQEIEQRGQQRIQMRQGVRHPGPQQGGGESIDDLLRMYGPGSR